jgi:quinol monooxygenase YgiN
MKTKPITVVARLRAMSGKEEELRQVLLDMIAPSRKDAGCISYDLHQSPEHKSCFLFFENWETKEHLDKHLTTSHLKAFNAKSPNLLAEPPQITLWERISE